MNKHKVYNLNILDESGSMQAIKKSTINGFNELIQTNKPKIMLISSNYKHSFTNIINTFN